MEISLRGGSIRDF